MNNIPGVPTRAHLADLCNDRRITVAAEIGTDIGVYARQFMERFRGDLLMCIDPYEPYGQMPYDRTGDMLVAIHALAEFHGRVKFVKARSLDAAAGARPDWYVIGCVYIDGEHTYEAVRDDIAAWWPVLDHGGLLAGHDWCKQHPGVVRAVTEFAVREGLDVWVTQERDCPQSWYVTKP